MNSNNAAAPTEVQVMRAMIINGQKLTKTMLKKTNEPNEQVAAKGCIVPQNALNAKKPIVLTPAGKGIFDLWQAGDVELVQRLDRNLMEQLRALLVNDSAARDNAEKVMKKVRFFLVKLFSAAKKVIGREGPPRARQGPRQGQALCGRL
jgi:hypothetical protein